MTNAVALFPASAERQVSARCTAVDNCRAIMQQTAGAKVDAMHDRGVTPALEVGVLTAIYNLTIDTGTTTEAPCIPTESAAASMNRPSPTDPVSTSYERALAEVVRVGDPYRLIFETTFQFIGLMDTQGTLLEVNRSALDWVRTRREDVVGQPVWATPWWANAGDAVLDQLKAAVAEAGSGDFVRYDVTLASIEGAAHTFDFSLMPVAGADGQVVLLVAEGRDITEQKRLEQALRDANHQLLLAQAQARQLAITDELTGQPPRLLSDGRAAEAHRAAHAGARPADVRRRRRPQAGQ